MKLQKQQAALSNKGSPSLSKPELKLGATELSVVAGLAGAVAPAALLISLRTWLLSGRSKFD